MILIGSVKALKEIPRENPHGPVDPKRIMQEKAALSSISHPHVIGLICTLKDEFNLYFVLEYIDSRVLYKCIWNHPGKRLPEPIVKQIASQVTLALEAVHSHGFVHRDLKSGNILVDRVGNCKLIDFGFAKKLDVTTERTISFCGTHYCMAPETFSRTGSSFEVDWW